MADAEGVETGGEALALRADHRLQQVSILRPLEAAGSGAEPQVEAAEVLSQSIGRIRQPLAAVEPGITEQAQRPCTFAHCDDVEGRNRRQRIQGRGERGGRSVPVRMPGRVLHRPVSAHRQSRQQLAAGRPVDGEVRFEEGGYLLGMEARPVVDLAADGQPRIRSRSSVGHDDEVRGIEGELLGGSEIRPRPEVVASSVKEVDDRAHLGGNPRQKHTHTDGAPERGGVEEEFTQPRREFPFVPDMPGPGVLPAGFGPEE